MLTQMIQFLFQLSFYCRFVGKKTPWEKPDEKLWITIFSLPHFFPLRGQLLEADYFRRLLRGTEHWNRYVLLVMKKIFTLFSHFLSSSFVVSSEYFYLDLTRELQNTNVKATSMLRMTAFHFLCLWEQNFCWHRKKRILVFFFTWL